MKVEVCMRCHEMPQPQGRACCSIDAPTNYRFDGRMTIEVGRCMAGTALKCCSNSCHRPASFAVPELQRDCSPVVPECKLMYVKVSRVPPSAMPSQASSPPLPEAATPARGSCLPYRSTLGVSPCSTRFSNCSDVMSQTITLPEPNIATTEPVYWEALSSIGGSHAQSLTASALMASPTGSRSPQDRTNATSPRGVEKPTTSLSKPTRTRPTGDDAMLCAVWPVPPRVR
mmetsp:Transcript_2947/g.6441  ORF Transcript_2947/g.6441 Transcript_2947/m.6441 type:complete len:229 (+) Transcript_2947:165-851(+)